MLCTLSSGCEAGDERTRRSGLSVGEGAPRHGGDRVDGGDILSAAVVRLSRRCGTGIGKVRDLQGDGAAALFRHHDSGDDRDLAGWTGTRYLGSFLGGSLADGEARPRRRYDLVPRLARRAAP